MVLVVLVDLVEWEVLESTTAEEDLVAWVEGIMEGITVDITEVLGDLMGSVAVQDITVEVVPVVLVDGKRGCA